MNQEFLKRLFFVVLPKLPVFVLALPLVLLMRLLRPLVLIRLIPIFERIGHGLGNTDCYLLDRAAGFIPSKGVDIFYPDRPWKCNRQMIKMWKRIIPVYDLVYWIAWANLEIPGGRMHHYERPQGDRDVHGLTYNAPSPLFFTIQEQEQGEALLRSMGIPLQSKYICFYTRDSAFLKASVPGQDWGYHDYRDVDIKTLELTIKELVARGYYCIRMGRAAKHAFAWENPHVIDYAISPWRSDFADMYLIAKSHFCIGDSCGLHSIAWVFRKHWISVNMIPLQDAAAWTSRHFFIFKKIWSLKQGKFIPFKEILAWDWKIYAFSDQYTKLGLQIINNTPEEIRDAVLEKEERIRGNWQTTREYEDLQRQFWALYPQTPQFGRARVGSKFLAENHELLHSNNRYAGKQA